MIFTFIPIWIAVCISAVVLAMSVIALIKVEIAAELVSKTEANIKQKTVFIKILTAKAESLIAEAKENEIKSLTQEIYEAIRYSDPISSGELLELENDIKATFDSFANAVRTNNIEQAKNLSEKVLNAVNTRNKMCKVLK